MMLASRNGGKAVWSLILVFVVAPADSTWASEVIATSTPMTVTVDTSRLARHLLRSELTIPVKPGRIALWYPKWIPGIHGPGEQIRNMAGLQVRAASGESLNWTRDPDELYRFWVDVPDGVDELRIDLTYIANQPTRVSTGVDAYGNLDLLAINFNTCLVYPDGEGVDKLPVQLRINLPDGWKYGTSLAVLNDSVVDSVDDSKKWLTFQTVSLETLIDSPLIAGKNYRRIEVDVPNFPPTRYHFISEFAEALEFGAELEQKFEQLMVQSAELFGGAPYDSYDFLILCSDEVPGMGLEHHRSSLNCIDREALTKDEEFKERPATLLPHELVHAWCGKYRRPIGMYRTNYHETKRTNLLWVYEGLTQYLGHVLAVRSGMLTLDDELEMMGGRIGYMSNRAGRNWRSLEDTAVAGHTLRGGSKRWNDLRRNQDYYDEGALFWMEVDVRLRAASDGKLSLDDFCQRFFSVPENRDQPVRPYDLDEIVQVLNELHPSDWRQLIESRVLRQQQALPLEAISLGGYQLTYTAERSEALKRREKEREYISAEHSLGLEFTPKGEITAVIPGGLADEVGLTEGMIVVGVNQRKFDEELWRTALDRTRESGAITVLILDHDTFVSKTIQYDGGPRYPVLTPLTDGSPDWLSKIFAPR